MRKLSRTKNYHQKLPGQELSQDSGSATVLAAYFEELIPDRELAEVQPKYPIIRSREELYYFRLFTEHFGISHAVETVGQ